MSTVITDAVLDGIRDVLAQCELEQREGMAPNADYNEGWIEALRYAIHHLENFEECNDCDLGVTNYEVTAEGTCSWCGRKK